MKFLRKIAPFAKVAASLVPGLGQAVTVLNAVMPADRQLSPDATGQQLADAYDELPASKQRQVDDRAGEIELAEIQQAGDNLAAMVSVESKGRNTRPAIAFLMAGVVVAVSLCMCIVWLRATWTADAEVLAQLKDSWEMALVLLGTPSALLRAYFGMRTLEKRARMTAATGQDLGAAGLLAGIGKLLGRK